MNAIIALFGVTLVPVTTLIALWIRHRRDQRKADVELEAIEEAHDREDMEAISNSAASLAKAFQIIVDPLKEEIERQRDEIHSLRSEVEGLRAQVAHAETLSELNRELERRVAFNDQRVTELTGVTRSLIRYTRRLRAQIADLGGQPEELPEGLGHLDD